MVVCGLTGGLRRVAELGGVPLPLMEERGAGEGGPSGPMATTSTSEDSRPTASHCEP